MTDHGSERFDVLTAEGAPTGRTKSRSQVHRDGDWHRSFHLWIGWRDRAGQPRVLFQRRALGKDTWPDHLDVAVGGHFGAGETIDDVFREVEEELGFAPERARCIHAGTRYAESIDDGWIDREVQEVFALALPRPPADLRPEPSEISALYTLSTSDVEPLITGRVASIPAQRAIVGLDRSLGTWGAVDVARDDFIRVPDGYWEAGARLTEQLLSGDPTPRLVLRRSSEPRE